MINHVQTVAILIDGGFFLKRYNTLVNPARGHTPEQVAKNLYSPALRHVGNNFLYRIFFYDCTPYDKIAFNPVSKKAIDFKKTSLYKFKIALFEELKKKRKIALRLGVIKDSQNWSFRPGLAKDLLEKKNNAG
jgi:hypothetical protein